MKNLNKEQLKAVQHKNGPLLIVAGAGTGKTTVITQRIAYLIEQGLAESDEILALTFTEKAAGEMEERVDRLLPFGYLDLWISTFHGFGERILKTHGLDIGLSNDFKLLNEFEQYNLIKKNLEKLELDYYKPLGNPTKFIRALVKHFSRCKDEDISPASYLSYAEELRENLDDSLSGAKKKKNGRNFQFSINNFQLKDGEITEEMAAQEISRINEVANAYHVYQQLLLDNNALDFGDLINYCLKLFRERPLILEQYRKKFKYILLDEFQDTNLAQYELIKLLAAPKNNLVVVGDDDQCLPSESLILTKNSKKRIDKIKAGDEVATAVGKGYLSYSKVNFVNVVKKKSLMINFKTKNGYNVEVTDNHKMFCYLPAKSNGENIFYVYLMHKRKLGWRMGITRDISVRLRLERGADKIIAIKNFSTEEEARYNEALWSLKYGIPTACFQERGGIMDKKIWSGKLYKNLDVEKSVNKLAQDLNIDLNAHQMCLEAVNRGKKIRIKINLELCHRNYRSKYAKGVFLESPQILHLLSIETSHQETCKKLEALGYKLKGGKKGKRLRLASADIVKLGKIALEIQKKVGGIIEYNSKIATANVQYKKSLIIPAKNILPGMYLPVFTGKDIIYDKVITRKEEKKNIKVYDLEVDKTHNFIADNIIVHNSIYKFRGASVSNILQFKKDFPEAKELVLVNNYRNRQNILDLSYDFIQQNNPDRLEVKLSLGKKKLDKKLKSQTGEKGKIEVIEGGDLQEEVRGVVEKISDLRIENKNLAWSDFAILVRANDSASEFCCALDEIGFPYQFLSSRGLYSKPLIMDIISYFKLLDNYHESIAMYRVLNISVFEFTYQELVNFNYIANKKAWSLYTVLKDANGKFGREIQNKIDKVLKLIGKHTFLARDKNTSEVFLAFLNDSGYLQSLISMEESRSIENTNLLNHFLKRIKTFEAGSDDKSVKAFLRELEEEMEAGEQGSLPIDIETGPDTIKIMTIHASKGLEFKYVFLANMVDKRFPTIERKEPILIPEALIKEVLPEGDAHLQEERRLFYVAATRAKDGLYFSWSRDYGGARDKKPSRFLLESSLIKEESKKVKKENKVKDNLKNNKTPTSTEGKACINIPKFFSYTQLAAFSNCPYQYRFAHILKIPRTGKAAFSYGKTMHSTLQKTFELVQARRKTKQADLFGADEKTKSDNPKVSLDEIISFFNESWIDEWYQSEKQKEEYRQRGKDSVKEFYNKHKDNWPKAEMLEKGFNIKITVDNELYTIRGAIDRVDSVGDKLKIVDYKTGAPKEKLTFDEKEQLLLYQLASSQIFDREVAGLSFYYFDNNTEIEFLGTDKELGKIQDKVINTIRDIKKCEFPPKPGPLCAFCDFKDICEFKK